MGLPIACEETPVEEAPMQMLFLDLWVFRQLFLKLFVKKNKNFAL